MCENLKTRKKLQNENKLLYNLSLSAHKQIGSLALIFGIDLCYNWALRHRIFSTRGKSNLSKAFSPLVWQMYSSSEPKTYESERYDLNEESNQRHRLPRVIFEKSGEVQWGTEVGRVEAFIRLAPIWLSFHIDWLLAVCNFCLKERHVHIAFHMSSCQLCICAV